MIRTRKLTFFLEFVVICTSSGWAQSQVSGALPAAPSHLERNSIAMTQPMVELSTTFPPQSGMRPGTDGIQAGQSAPAAGGLMRLTRTQAEQLAITNNPRVSVGRLLALAQHQIYRETRAAALPSFNGAITAVNANEGS